MSVFALVDCNNFYASCERVFNPRLINRPVIILSNNDGCIVARSNEAKQLGIPMGVPFFKWRAMCQKNNVAVFSSNYELYGDMSGRVMTLLGQFCKDMECYSIDEAFLRLEGVDSKNLMHQLQKLRHIILRGTGIPVSIGIASTKTLAKVAGCIAKKQATSGVFDMQDSHVQEEVLTAFPVGDLWGVGRQLVKRLHQRKVITAKDLRDSHAPTLKKSFGLPIERIMCELRGQACYGLEAPCAHQQIISSRSFPKPVSNPDELEEALSHFTAIACKKLRAEKSVSSRVQVFIHTNPFNNDQAAYHASGTYRLPQPTSDTIQLLGHVKTTFKKIFKPGLHYKKAGIVLMDISQESHQQRHLFLAPTGGKREALMQTVDRIQHKMGKQSVGFLAEGIDQPWKHQRTQCSPGYTTCWNEIPMVHVLCSRLKSVEDNQGS